MAGTFAARTLTVSVLKKASFAPSQDRVIVLSTTTKKMKVRSTAAAGVQVQVGGAWKTVPYIYKSATGRVVYSDAKRKTMGITGDPLSGVVLVPSAPVPGPTPAPTPTPTPTPAPRPAYLDDATAFRGPDAAVAGIDGGNWRGVVLNRLNAARAAKGVAPLALCNAQNQGAQWKANQMARRNLMTHFDDIGSVGEVISSFGYPGGGWWAENIAEGYPDGNSVSDGWTNSPGHYSSMINPMYTVVGIGVQAASNGRLYWAEEFGGQSACNG